MADEPCGEVAYAIVGHAIKALEVCLRRAMLVGDAEVEYVATYCSRCSAIHLRAERR